MSSMVLGLPHVSDVRRTESGRIVRANLDCDGREAQDHPADLDAGPSLELPTNAKDWRQGSAVLDEWNHDGFIVVGTVLPGHSLPACTGLIAEQAGVQLAPQYLKGGAKQAMIKLPEDVAKQLGDAALKAEKTGHEVIEAGGIRWELRATGWADVNGIHGYLQAPGTASTQTQRVAARAIVSKKENDKEKE